ncbi:hypothetical protein HKCCE2091_18435 [Rhodobacterales bacterium HKCCE2091]|nr:hypothetical protein [Rhodobacterales bacterium HKCCE2091]
MLDVTDNTTPSAQPNLRVAICGEFRSGKSALLNALFGSNLLRDNVGKDNRPTVFAEWGERTEVEYFDVSGQTIATADAKDPNRACDIQTVQVMFDNPAFSKFEFFEIPFSNAENITSHQADLVRSSDILIWVTIGSQAWRLTEKSIFDALADIRPANCIIAVSRADKLRRQADRDKVRDRIARETGAYFQGIVFMSNSRRRIDGKGPKADVMVDTAADVILAELTGAAGRQVVANRAAADTAGQDQDRSSAPSPETSETPRTAVAANAEDPAEPASTPVVGTVSAASAPDFADLMGEGVVLGMFESDASPDCTPLLGETEACQKLGETCRVLRARWLETYQATDAISDAFTVAIRTDTHSIHMHAAPDASTYFMLADLSKLNYGSAHNRFNMICQKSA